MLDLRFIRENPDKVKAGLRAKHAAVDLDTILEMDSRRREHITTVDRLKAEKNKANDAITACLKEKKDAQPIIGTMKTIALEIDRLEPLIKKLEFDIQNLLLAVPNIP